MLPANASVNYFIDWDDFRGSFWKEFFPLHAEAVATNALEGTTYFQGTRNVDDYLDEFRDLVSASGYTSPKTIVVKFRQGLDIEIGDVIATMATGRPDDVDPEGWFEAACYDWFHLYMLLHIYLFLSLSFPFYFDCRHTHNTRGLLFILTHTCAQTVYMRTDH